MALARVDANQREIDQAPLLPAASLQARGGDFTVRYAYETTALEGNTLSPAETQAVLETGVTIGGKSVREQLEVLNMRDALDWLRQAVRADHPPDEETLRTLNPGRQAGSIRSPLRPACIWTGQRAKA
ncbi:protein of unknown function [Candidatus Hydrogenisulfobacillus filiaventi]|uniref:Uncharacterized protein n=1 Tax=Candidatus Hydrogenisulfobacillus filiaventi TaxID=2707344 RepID=A0A6F8ZHX9_9FIRM|nr:protein of unknown function [Candidatus Hydrogenisulfobacillus filiaventi]